MSNRSRRAYGRSRTTALGAAAAMEAADARRGSDAPAAPSSSGGVLKSGLNLLHQLSSRVRGVSGPREPEDKTPPSQPPATGRSRNEFRSDVAYHPLVYKYARLERAGADGTGSRLAHWEEKYKRRAQGEDEPGKALEQESMVRNSGNHGSPVISEVRQTKIGADPRPERSSHGYLYDNDPYDRPASRQTRHEERPASRQARRDDRPSSRQAHYEERPSSRQAHYEERPSSRQTFREERPVSRQEQERPTSRHANYTNKSGAGARWYEGKAFEQPRQNFYRPSGYSDSRPPYPAYDSARGAYDTSRLAHDPRGHDPDWFENEPGVTGYSTNRAGIESDLLSSSRRYTTNKNGQSSHDKHDERREGEHSGIQHRGESNHIQNFSTSAYDPLSSSDLGQKLGMPTSRTSEANSLGVPLLERKPPHQPTKVTLGRSSSWRLAGRNSEKEPGRRFRSRFLTQTVPEGLDDRISTPDDKPSPVPSSPRLRRRFIALSPSLPRGLESSATVAHLPLSHETNHAVVRSPRVPEAGPSLAYDPKPLQTSATTSHLPSTVETNAFRPDVPPQTEQNVAPRPSRFFRRRSKSSTGGEAKTLKERLFSPFASRKQKPESTEPETKPQETAKQEDVKPVEDEKTADEGPSDGPAKVEEINTTECSGGSAELEEEKETRSDETSSSDDSTSSSTTSSSSDDDEEIPTLIPSDRSFGSFCHDKLQKLKLSEPRETVADEVLDQLQIDQTIDLHKLQRDLDKASEERRKKEQEEEIDLYKLQRELDRASLERMMAALREKKTNREDEIKQREKEERRQKVARTRPQIFIPEEGPGPVSASERHESCNERLPVGDSLRLPNYLGPSRLLDSKQPREENNNEDLGGRLADFSSRHPVQPLQKSASAIIKPASIAGSDGSLPGSSRLRLNDYDPAFGIYSRLDPSTSRTSQRYAGAAATTHLPAEASASSSAVAGSKLDNVYLESASARRYRRIRDEVKTRSANSNRPAQAPRPEPKVDGLPSVCCGPVLSARRARLLRANSPFGSHVSSVVFLRRAVEAVVSSGRFFGVVGVCVDPSARY